MIPILAFALGKRTLRRIEAEDADMLRLHYVELLFFSVGCATLREESHFSCYFRRFCFTVLWL